jgi:alkylation response protein AidB-like acyl-CoA dehydrogenase
MNLSLSDEQELLREAARGALSRVPTIEAAHAALEGGELPDLWPTAREAGWTGLLVSEEHGGAGLSPFDAMLVMVECGRVLAGVPLLGHLPASWLLDRGGYADIEAIAAGDKRAAFVAAAPPDDLGNGWTWEPARGKARVPAGDNVAHWVVDAPGADVFVVVGAGGSVTVVEGATVEPASRYDATRSLGHVSLATGTSTALAVQPADAASAWHLTQALIAAESLGTVETCLEMALAYAKERYTFGRAIGSYQAIKHQIVEMLRGLENGRSLLYYAGWAGESKADEFPLAASAARSVAGRALDQAARANISVHGGIGATWEHDAPLYFRRAQLSRRLLGGTAGASDRVSGELFATVAAAA